MKKAEVPLDRLLRWSSAMGMNQTELARRMGVVPQDITNWKRRGMPSDWHAKAAEVTGRSIDELVGRIPEHGARTKRGLAGTYIDAKVFRIPVVGTAQLGGDGYWTEIEHPVGAGDGYMDMPSRDPNAYAVRVIGDSMHPRIKSGEYVVVAPNLPLIIGEEVLVVTKDGRSMVKDLLFRRDGLVALQSVNASYERLTLREDEIEKIHYVAAISKTALYMPEDAE